MATITITLPDPIAGRVIDAICELYGYDAENVDHGTKPVFAKQQIIAWLRTNTITHEVGKAAATAQAQARTESETAITGIT